MSTMSSHRTRFFRAPESGLRHQTPGHVQRLALWRAMKMDSEPSNIGEVEELSLQTIAALPTPQVDTTKSPSNLHFDRVQQLDRELWQENIQEFGQFVAREALLDEEYWTAAWLRAESHWEDRANDRYALNFKRKFAEQEFNAIKRRHRGRNGQKCMCIVTVKKEHGNVNRMILKSIVGTLDLSIQYLLHGETFPGERVRDPLFGRINEAGPARYGYIGNLCVAKSARRQGIASNMMSFALESSKRTGVEQVYMHVHRDNGPAQELYAKMGFKMVEEAAAQLVEEPTHLLCLEI
ncbi:uncharacterized protein LOC115740963 isoform X2 [Rhodamnia argentea]|uniref:Uncharacterized protein LOC115740963 isoform X2 n=1 Tax=Rhodamnia argentea TaxID=178133 RepID=A0A8B8P797_9MYRT|nr:uncharacterized protein LOC115740963 isoform X2 [Rhodamnia argentea]